jgi:ABC-type arginine transport system ATPase subunit
MNRVRNFTGNHATEKQSPTESSSLKENRPLKENQSPKENRPPVANQSSHMDVPRTGVKARKIRRRIMIGGAAVVGLVAIAIGLAQLKPALPTVARNSVWIDTVKRGPLLRQVRGLGTLVPEDISWIAARNDARVDKIIIWPGTEVNADSVILELTNPELQQAALDADAAVTSAQARLVNLKAQLQTQSLERRAALTQAEGARDAANAERDVNERLAKEGLIAALDLKKSQITAREKTASFEIEKQRYDFTQQAIEPQLAVAQSDLDQAKAYHLLDDLTVYENIEIPLSYRNVPPRERESIVCDALDRFNIVGKRDLFPNQLSGGQQQLVGVVRAIVAKPELILADEPTGNLHSDQAREIMQLFRKLNDEGTTIVQVTHSEENASYGKRIIRLKDGWIERTP